MFSRGYFVVKMLFKTLEFIFSYSTIKDLKQKSSISCYTFSFSTLNSIAEIFINHIFRFSRFLVVKLTLTLIDHASLLRQRKDSNLSTDVSLPIAKYVFLSICKYSSTTIESTNNRRQCRESSLTSVIIPLTRQTQDENQRFLR